MSIRLLDTEFSDFLRKCNLRKIELERMIKGLQIPKIRRKVAKFAIFVLQDLNKITHLHAVSVVTPIFEVMEFEFFAAF